MLSYSGRTADMFAKLQHRHRLFLLRQSCGSLETVILILAVRISKFTFLLLLCTLTPL